MNGLAWNGSGEGGGKTGGHASDVRHSLRVSCIRFFSVFFVRWSSSVCPSSAIDHNIITSDGAPAARGGEFFVGLLLFGCELKYYMYDAGGGRVGVLKIVFCDELGARAQSGRGQSA